jgi:hypothetical protein
MEKYFAIKPKNPQPHVIKIQLKPRAILKISLMTC